MQPRGSPEKHTPYKMVRQEAQLYIFDLQQGYALNAATLYRTENLQDEYKLKS